MSRYRNYWAYSVGLAIAWTIALVIVSVARPLVTPHFFLVFGGFVIGWVSTTIARYVYPPPRKWSRGGGQCYLDPYWSRTSRCGKGRYQTI